MIRRGEVATHRGRFEPGDRLGPYQLCELIGAGGMSRVYLAVADGRIGRRRYVAVKCMRDEQVDDHDFATMFRDEIRVATQIDHPNVYTVFDWGVHHDAPYLVMEHLAGCTFTRIRRRIEADPEALPAERRTALVARLMVDACEGVRAIHEARDLCDRPLAAVHRDICTSNLFVTCDGSTVVLDLGVARSAGQRHTTQPGVVKGKYGYLAPELLDGSPPDRSSDVWALGVVAWEMLTGRRLFAGASDIEILRAIDGGAEIKPPSRVAPGVSELADEVVMGALERRRGRRFSDARELGDFFGQLMIEVGPPVGLGEVAETVDRMFPDLRRDARRLFDRAESLELPLMSSDELGVVDGSTRSVDIEVVKNCSSTARTMPAAMFQMALAIIVLLLAFASLTCTQLWSDTCGGSPQCVDLPQ